AENESAVKEEHVRILKIHEHTEHHRVYPSGIYHGYLGVRTGKKRCYRASVGIAEDNKLAVGLRIGITF
ncbi:MAG: hypothetical protein II199_00065, partial [Bacteroidaceae bacterium]|nr:hypothetical protein [Bacteroidaceae bacterium]